MESRKLAALLSSLISQLLLLLLLIFPPNNNNNNSVEYSSSNNNNNNNSAADSNSFLLVHHFLLSQQIAATLSLKRKKKRPRDALDPEEPDPNDPFGPLTRSPDSFRNSFNMTSSTFEWLAGLLEPLLDCRDPAELLPLNLTAGARLGIGLFRLANGSDYPEISTRFGVPVSVARFCVKHLCRVLCTNFRFWVSFPNQNDIVSVSQGFESLTGLPHCCGAVHCTRFEVSSSSYSSSSSPSCVVAAQIVVDSSCRILTIVAGFLGNKSNSRILKASTLCQDIEEGKLLNAPAVKVNNVVELNQYLVGGGGEGYPLLPWLMVPFCDAVSGFVEESFNEALEAMRIPAIRTAASLRNWGVLSGPVREEVKMAVAYIGACSILHNGLLMRDDSSALAGGSEVEDYQLQQQRYREFCRLEDDDDSITEKALVIRSTLATLAKKHS